MKQDFTVGIWQEGNWYVAQCLEIDLASQGKTEPEALANIQEAIELFLEPPTPDLKTYPDLFLENISRVCRLEFSDCDGPRNKAHDHC